MMKKYYWPMVVLTAIIIGMALVKGAGLVPIDSVFPEGEVAEITEITAQNWTELENGTGVYYTIPEEDSAAQVLELTSSWNSMDVYLEDELLYSFSDDYHELGRASHWIEIPAASNGKRIIVTSDAGLSALESALEVSSYLGTADAIRRHFFMKNLPSLLLAAVDLMMVGIVILILCVLWHKIPARLVRGIWDLLFFIVLNGIWIISDSGFPECLTARTGLWALISYIAWMLMPVFMVSFARNILSYRRKLLRKLAMASLGLTAITLVLYLTRLAPLSTLLVFHHVLMVLDAVVVFLLCNHEIRSYRIKRLEPIRNGTAIMGAFEILAVLLYWQHMNAVYSLFYAAGFTSYIVCLTISVVQQAYYNLGKKAELNTYRKLAYKDVMTMVYNRSAFEKYQKGIGADVRSSAYILFDVNGLKSVNDTRGHQAGDDLIIRAATCIRETFEEAGNCYRIGGDEFMVVLGNIHEEEEVLNLLTHFEKQMWMSNERLTEEQMPLSVAYGYSIAGEEPRSAEEMYEEADGLMYAKKQMMKEAAS